MSHSPLPGLMCSSFYLSVRHSAVAWEHLEGRGLSSSGVSVPHSVPLSQPLPDSVLGSLTSVELPVPPGLSQTQPQELTVSPVRSDFSRLSQGPKEELRVLERMAVRPITATG